MSWVPVPMSAVRIFIKSLDNAIKMIYNLSVFHIDYIFTEKKMIAKKLVSMRINNITDEKLTSLANEIGETKANLISMAVTYLYDKHQEEKRMKEIASQAE